MRRRRGMAAIPVSQRNLATGRHRTIWLVLPSALVFGDRVEDRLPRLLLLVNEGGGLGGRPRIGEAPQRRKLLLRLGGESHFAQAFAALVDDRRGRANGRHRNSPAIRLTTWNCFR